jgi:hypothetical protein
MYLYVILLYYKGLSASCSHAMQIRDLNVFLAFPPVTANRYTINLRRRYGVKIVA